MTNVEPQTQSSSNEIQLFADFDSANMARYERVALNQTTNATSSNGQTNKFQSQQSTSEISNSTNEQNEQSQQNQAPIQIKIDAEFNVWTKPDCDGTAYINGNRTWFYFGVRGGHGKLLKFNIMNLNRQGKLFEMGMLPVFKTVPGNEKWSRIYNRPTWQNVDLNFQMSFNFRIPDKRGSITYFAFCFPYSYDECQNHLLKYDIEFRSCLNIEQDKCNADTIYYHRELLCYSLDYRRIDLITISSCYNMSNAREPRFDQNLFPDKNTPRPYTFEKKRVFVLTSRVHPGETPASFVFNGFLDFILNRDDPRAKMLRKQFVFKLIPILNPDGVARGHYRTDQYGRNLNRFYLDPNFKLHPSIYAAKSLVVYHHIYNRTSRDHDGLNFDDIFQMSNENEAINESQERPIFTLESVKDNLVEKFSNEPLINSDKYIGNENSDDEELNDDLNDNSATANTKYSPHLSDPRLLQINPLCSGVAFYIDLHGHAAKRGCFIYGNALENELYQVENVLFAKLITFNSQHFDFDGCNFSIKNMYFKDKREGLSKEGSGRVALYKATGIIHSYTLECCYACGRCMNTISPAVNSSLYSGRISPPLHSDMPPKFLPDHYKNVGKGLAIAALDICEQNPCSRIPNTTFGSLESVRNWVKFYIRSKMIDKQSGNRKFGIQTKRQTIPNDLNNQTKLIQNPRRLSSSILVQSSSNSANKLINNKKMSTAPLTKSITPIVPLQSSQSEKRLQLGINTATKQESNRQRKSSFNFLKTMPTIQLMNDLDDEEPLSYRIEKPSNLDELIVDDDTTEDYTLQHDELILQSSLSNKKPLSNRNTSRELFPINKANVIHVDDNLKDKNETNVKKTAEIISARVNELSKLVNNSNNFRKSRKQKSTTQQQTIKPEYLYSFSFPFAKKPLANEQATRSETKSVMTAPNVGVNWTVNQHVNELKKQHYELNKLIKSNTKLNLKKNRKQSKQGRKQSQQQNLNEDSVYPTFEMNRLKIKESQNVFNRLTNQKLPNISIKDASSRTNKHAYWIDI